MEKSNSAIDRFTRQNQRIFVISKLCGGLGDTGAIEKDNKVFKSTKAY